MFPLNNHAKHLFTQSILCDPLPSLPVPIIALTKTGDRVPATFSAETRLRLATACIAPRHHIIQQIGILILTPEYYYGRARTRVGQTRFFKYISDNYRKACI